MDQQSITIFNYYVGALAIGGGLITTFVFCYSRLPRARMKAFQGVLLETRNLYQQVKDEGLVPVSITDEFETRLRELEESSISLRDSTHQCTSLVQEVIAACHGLSTAIQISVRKAVSLQAKIATASEEQRRMRSLLATPQTCSLATGADSGTSTRGEAVDLPDNNEIQPPLTDHMSCFSPGSGSFRHGDDMPETDSDSSSTVFSVTGTVGRAYWKICILAFLQQWRHRSTKEDLSTPDLESGIPAAGINHDSAVRP